MGGWVGGGVMEHDIMGLGIMGLDAMPVFCSINRKQGFSKRIL